ncbi:MAG: FmdE family protein [Promethearchaeota archaeon]
MEELPSELKNAVEFHGHLCPGIVIGFRVAILARKELELGRSEDEELVAVVENDTCAVDAIQYINGTTFGKGNLVFQDHGLHAYTFIERNSGKQIRIALKADVFQEESEQRREILRKQNQNKPLTEEENAVLQKARQNMLKKLLTMSDAELFSIVKNVDIKVPERARIFNSVKCSKCGLMVMETRLRVLNDKFYCIPCWEHELASE